MEKVTKSLKISAEIWRKIKIHCAEKEITVSQYIEELVKKDLK